MPSLAQVTLFLLATLRCNTNVEQTFPLDDGTIYYVSRK
jgi:hypothetical protein